MNIPGYAAIISAISSIPQGIKAMRDLLAGNSPDVATLSAKLSEIEASLKQYAGASTWLGEAKELHDLVVHIQTALEPAYNEARQAFENPEGKFSPDGFKYTKVRSLWIESGTQRTDLRRFSMSPKQLFECVQLDASGKATAGPPWLTEFFNIERRIDALFDKGDNIASIPPKLKQELCALMGYRGGMRSVMVDAVGTANGLIRALAGQHAAALEALAWGLK